MTGSSGRLHFGMAAGIKSERWPIAADSLILVSRKRGGPDRNQIAIIDVSQRKCALASAWPSLTVARDLSVRKDAEFAKGCIVVSTSRVGRMVNIHAPACNRQMGVGI